MIDNTTWKDRFRSEWQSWRSPNSVIDRRQNIESAIIDASEAAGITHRHWHNTDSAWFVKNKCFHRLKRFGPAHRVVALSKLTVQLARLVEEPKPTRASPGSPARTCSAPAPCVGAQTAQSFPTVAAGEPASLQGLCSSTHKRLQWTSFGLRSRPGNLLMNIAILLEGVWRTSKFHVGRKCRSGRYSHLPGKGSWPPKGSEGGGGSFSIQKFILQIIAIIDNTKNCNVIFRNSWPKDRL